MSNITVNIKRLDPTVELPKYAHSTDAGLDLRSNEDCILKPFERRLVSTGLAIALPDGYALLQYDDENYNTIAIQTYGGEGLLWSSAGEAQQYTYASYLTSTASGPVLTARRDSRDGSSLYDVLDMEGNLLLRRLGSCYSPDDLPDDCFIARQGFDYGLMDSTGQWLYRESIFSSPSDDAGGGYLY